MVESFHLGERRKERHLQLLRVGGELEGRPRLGTDRGEQFVPLGLGQFFVESLDLDGNFGGHQEESIDVLRAL